MKNRLLTYGRRVPTLGAGIAIGLLVGIPFTIRGGNQTPATAASDVHIVNKSDDAVFVRFPSTDDGRKVIVSNDENKPVRIDPVKTIKVETTNLPAVLNVSPTKYTYQFFTQDQLQQEIRTLRGNPAEKAVNFLNSGNWEIVDTIATGAFMQAAGFDLGNRPGVLLRKPVAPVAH
jgi:hypothetical protein